VAVEQTLASLAAQWAVHTTRAFGPGTQRTYRSASAKYTGWCASHRLDSLGGATGPLPLYITHFAETGGAMSSIRAAFAAIATVYRVAGLPPDLCNPQLALLVEGIIRSVGNRLLREAARPCPRRYVSHWCNGVGTRFAVALAARDRSRAACSALAPPFGTRSVWR
jgi:hypothetical protein